MLVQSAHSRPLRHLLIGVDAMEWTLVRSWAQKGELSTLQGLMERGLQAELASFGDALPDAVWPSLYCGVNPGNIEKYFYVQYDPATSCLRYADDSKLSGTPFWQQISQAGKRVGVIDVPHLPLQQMPCGFQVSNWGTHEPGDKGAVTDPPALLSQIQTRFGRYPVEDCERYGFDVKSKIRLRRDLLAGVAQHGKLFRWLMDNQDWDVFVCCFCEAHCAGHHFWSYMDPSYPLHSENDPQGLSDTIRQTYRAIDREIGEMIALAGDQTRVLVFAAHGMGRLCHASWNLNEILDLLGHGRRRFAGVAVDKARSGKINPWRILKRVVPAPLQYAIKEMLPKRLQDQLVFLWYAGGRKCRGRKAFSVPNNDSVGAIRIGVKGRDHMGVVNPGEEYCRICSEISEALLELTDPVSGRPIVRKITRLQEEYHGPFVERLPDLAVLWDSRFSWNSVHSPRFGTLRVARQDRRSGSHTPEGFLLAVGPGVPAGLEIKGRSTLDIAPTVLEAAGVPVRDFIEGEPLPLGWGESVKQDVTPAI
jgi:predicted AlkP superfamily phosphohydrolase/phosphomutase